MNAQPVLTEKEWQLVAELLEQERRELAPEIRRTDTGRYRHDLVERLHTVEGIIARMKGDAVLPAPAPAPPLVAL
jgi:hypothetical protein